jgi:hypothetical protein
VGRLGDNEGAILWTPLLTPFVQTDTLAPKGPGFLPCGGRVEKDLKGRPSNRRGDLVGFSSRPFLLCGFRGFLWGSKGGSSTLSSLASQVGLVDG